MFRRRRTQRPTAGHGDGDVVVADQISKSFDDQEVIHGLDLSVPAGTVLGLIGPSGCGKTTTVRMMAGLLQPSSGRATVFGNDAAKLSATDRTRLGYLPQTPALFPDLSLQENLSFHASMYGLPFRRSERMTDLLEWVELAGDRSKRVSEASGGMQRRLALAASFVHDPEVIFLDEPTAGIDPILRDRLWTRFREVATLGKTLIVTTQYVGEAGKCDVVGLLSDGEILLLDTPEGLRQAAYGGDVIEAKLAQPLSGDDLDRLGQHPVVRSTERVDATTVHLVVEEATDAIPEVRSSLDDLGIEVVEIGEYAVDYDEAFVRVVERHRADNPSEVAVS